MGNATNEAQASSGNPITDLLGSVLGGGETNNRTKVVLEAFWEVYLVNNYH